MPKTMTIARLKRELAAGERKLTRLVAQRQKLAGQLAAADRDIAALGGEVPKTGKRRERKASKGAPGRRGRKLPKNVKPLTEYIKDVLSGSKDGMRVKEVEAAVKKAGYKTFSKDFYGVVAMAMRSGPFKKVSRGVYRLKVRKKRAKKAARKTVAKKKATSKIEK